MIKIINKLRIFDKSINKMFEVSSYDFDKEFLITSNKRLYNLKANSNNLYFMRGTLFDNYNLVYENDIIKINYIYYDFRGYDDCRLMTINICGILKFNNLNEPIIENIKFNDESYSDFLSISNFDCFNLYRLLESDVYSYDIKVIGNIFENENILNSVSEVLNNYNLQNFLKIHIFDIKLNSFVFNGNILDFDLNSEFKIYYSYLVEELYYCEKGNFIILKI